MCFKHQHTTLHIVEKFTVVVVYNLWLWFTDVLCVWHFKKLRKLYKVGIDTKKIVAWWLQLFTKYREIMYCCSSNYFFILKNKISVTDYLNLLNIFYLQDAMTSSVPSHWHPFVFIYSPLFPFGIAGKGQGRLSSPQSSHCHSAPFGLPDTFSPCMLQIWKKTNFWAGETKKLQFPCLSPWPVMK